MPQMQSYPLTWPAGWQRTPGGERMAARFAKKEQRRFDSGSIYAKTVPLSLNEAVGRIREALHRMGVHPEDIIISTNVRTRLDGLPRSGEPEPADPGVAVYWRESSKAETRCMAIDRYSKVAGNLAAVAATLEAMRAIDRHGGAAILDRAFMGFAALPSSTAGESWWDVLGVDALASEETIHAAYRALVRTTHPDNGGSDDAIRKVNIARDQALAAARGRWSK